MGAASFVLAINVFVAGLFAITFMVLAWRGRSRVPLWFGLTYLVASLYVVSEFILPFQGDPRLTYSIGFSLFHLSLAAAVAGIAERYRKAIPWELLAALVVLGIASGAISYDFERGSFARMMLYQAPFAAMHIAIAIMILTSRRIDRLDMVLAGLMVMGALQYLSKPFVATFTGGAGTSPQDYIATTYALYSQTMGTIVALTTGLMLLLILVRDMLVEITLRSETDALSGLYNRRGFDAHASALLDAAQRTGVPTAMVVADLDHFKSINDTHGHEAGDRVIEWFGAVLRGTASDRWVVGRMGGEEFAIFLSGANLTTARLFAESVRSAMAGLMPETLPDTLRVTASFGVSEGDGETSLADLRRRADAALYRAKSQGRDRVATAVAAPAVVPEANAEPTPTIKLRQA
ncbi:diguanylate cyclase (GGDEF) domain-containing protein [Devosia enhydra]|uniref:diguanylate cyclase n=1 Tax=Devosia enhydra TaxID=665118 RepID=A0A1K2HYY7_9HYPH|nr:GGDEF domain-containing protein [Devosia enhydra]SFZ85228.1 diguanylate cyclase (GGDEF) domain-containing protein [Devosia enhydra]